MANIDIENLAYEIAKTLTDYGQEIQKGVTKSAEKVAKKAVATLKTTSPKLTGKYAKGWVATKEQEFATDTNIIIHNKTSWQLSHLLENSHALRNGGRSKPQVHIKPVEEQAILEFTQEVKGAIENVTV